MFTGLVEMMGRLSARRDLRSGVRLSIEHDYEPPRHGALQLGESISVSGACLTVVDFGRSPDGRATFEIDASVETLAQTTLGEWQLGQKLNLERALALGARLGGHLVTGHVDGVGQVLSLTPEGEMTRVSIGVPANLARYVARKGSLCVDGVSLTVNDVTDGPASTQVELFVIPHTLAVTTLGQLGPGQKVNLEIDLVARYIERLLPGQAGGPGQGPHVG